MAGGGAGQLRHQVHQLQQQPEDVHAVGPHPRTGGLQVLQLAGDGPAQLPHYLDQIPRRGLAHVADTPQHHVIPRQQFDGPQRLDALEPTHLLDAVLS
ncbi:hypothetical protein D3C78_1693760 [compost metagenome]